MGTPMNKAAVKMLFYWGFFFFFLIEFKKKKKFIWLILDRTYKTLNHQGEYM